MDLIALAILCGFVAGFISFTALSLVWVTGLSVAIIFGPLAWSLLFVRPHPGTIGAFLLIVSIQIGSCVGLWIGYAIKVIWT